MDVVQEVMLAVHRASMKWEPSGRTGSFRAWLAETARRTTLAAIRFRDRTGDRLAFESLAPEDAVSDRCQDTASEDEQAWQFYEAVAAVERETNPVLWRAFWLTAIEAKPAQQVANELDMRLGSVYSAKSRVLSRIKQVIQELSEGSVQ
jgi:RNA polymerase sigma-70 factor (ECF subfamily)